LPNFQKFPLKNAKQQFDKIFDKIAGIRRRMKNLMKLPEFGADFSKITAEKR